MNNAVNSGLSLGIFKKMMTYWSARFLFVGAAAAGATTSVVIASHTESRPGPDRAPVSIIAHTEGHADSPPAADTPSLPLPVAAGPVLAGLALSYGWGRWRRKALK